MKGIGYRPEFAAAVEATASTGGKIMPPVMGSVAFIIAEFLGTSYMHVIAAALIPAILYYVSVFISVDLEAARTGLKGLKKKDMPRLMSVLREGWLPVFLQQKPVKGVIHLQHRKMLKIFLNAVHRENLFHEGFPSHLVISVAYAILIAFPRVDLPDPACVTVAGRADKNVWMKTAKMECFKVEIFHGIR